jgi:hypothetical protein
VARGSTATVGGTDLGEMGPAPEQAHLRDFAIPQRGLFVVGRAFFTDAADPKLEAERPGQDSNLRPTP